MFRVCFYFFFRVFTQQKMKTFMFSWRFISMYRCVLFSYIFFSLLLFSVYIYYYYCFFCCSVGFLRPLFFSLFGHDTQHTCTHTLTRSLKIISEEIFSAVFIFSKLTTQRENNIIKKKREQECNNTNRKRKKNKQKSNREYKKKHTHTHTIHHTQNVISNTKYIFYLYLKKSLSTVFRLC